MSLSIAERCDVLRHLPDDWDGEPNAIVPTDAEIVAAEAIATDLQTWLKPGSGYGSDEGDDGISPDASGGVWLEFERGDECCHAIVRDGYALVYSLQWSYRSMPHAAVPAAVRRALRVT